MKLLELILSLAAKLLGPIMIFFYGKKEAKYEALQKKADVQKKQMDIAARPVDSPDALIERMRRNKL